MRRTAMAACLACAASWSSLAQAVTYNVPPDALPATLSSGDVLNYGPGISTFDFLPSPPAGATVNIYGGNPDFDFSSVVRGDVNILGAFIPAIKAEDAEITIDGSGRLAYGALTRTHVTLLGGQLDELFGHDNVIDVRGGRFEVIFSTSFEGTTINLSSGDLGFAQYAIGGITVNVSGGFVGGLQLASGSDLNLSGGQVNDDTQFPITFVAHPGSQVHLFVRQATLDGSAIAGLLPGSTVELDVTSQSGLLAGSFADGSPFAIDLIPEFDMDAITSRPRIITNPLDVPAPFQPVDRVAISITVVPEPSTALLVLLAALAMAFFRAGGRHSAETSRWCFSGAAAGFVC